MFRKLTSTAGGIMFAAVSVTKVETSTPQASAAENQSNDLSHYVCKPSELPLYAPLHSHNKPQRTAHPAKVSKTQETIESGVRVVRTEMQAGYKIVEGQLKTLDHYVDTAKAHTSQTIDYLNQPHNLLPRSGAIAIGGLSGFIFAARGGFIKKVLYTTIGAGAVASLCYPRQAEQLARDALYEARKGFAITYNFVKGVKPGDEIPVEPINKFPTSLGEVKSLLWDLYDEAKETLLPKKK